MTESEECRIEKRDRNARKIIFITFIYIKKVLFFSFCSIEMKKKLVAVFVFDAFPFSFGIILPNMICLAS
jgi:hypothetical protein